MTNKDTQAVDARAPRVFCFGDCNIDILITIEKLPEPGGCAWSNLYKVDVGGTMLNTTVALKRLGVEAFPMTKTGDDYNGKLIRDYLAEQGVSVDRVLLSEYQTGLVVGLIEPGGEKRWIGATLNAANNHVREDELKFDSLPRYLFLAGSELAKGIESKQTSFALARRVSESGGKVFLDPNLRISDRQLPKNTAEAFERIMPDIDYLLANERETQLLGGSTDVERAARNIIDMGAKCVWVKKGEDGSCFFSSEESVDCEPFLSEVIDTSGAGDAFNAAAIYSICNGFDIRRTGRFANLFAGYTVGRIGTTSALPSREEIEKMIARSL